MISFRSNILSLKLQRQLDQTSSALDKSMSRLASGQRINSAADDSAGLAIASKLDVQARVFSRGVMNINDAISYLNIADSTLQDQSSIVSRLKELAYSAANGSLSLAQRRSLNAEAQSLMAEFNRSLASSKFNGQAVLDGAVASLGVQFGIGDSGYLALGMGQSLTHAKSSGGVTQSGSPVSGTGEGAVGDFNGDGRDDLVSTEGEVLISNGNGTFTSKAPLSHSFVRVESGDVNSDGKLDIVAGGGGSAYIYLGNGDGTFKSETQLASAGSAVALGDMNGDGNLDLVTNTGTQLKIYRGAGTGSFTLATSQSVISGFGVVQLQDLNGDGALDILTNSFASEYYVTFGNNSFTMGGQTAMKISGSALVDTGYTNPYADFNRDGLLDVVATDGVHFGNGDGTFAAVSTVFDAYGTATSQVADFNQDGIMDIWMNDDGDRIAELYFGRGDGYFDLVNDNNPGTTSTTLLGDFNGDGVPDIGLNDDFLSSFTIYTSNTSGTNTGAYLNLTTRPEALNAISYLETLSQRIQKEMGIIGSHQSRLQSALNTTQTTSANYTAAAGRIKDADTAEETASLLKNTIRQQVTTALLSQAKLSNSIGLDLLKF